MLNLVGGFLNHDVHTDKLECRIHNLLYNLLLCYWINGQLIFNWIVEPTEICHWCLLIKRHTWKHIAWYHGYEKHYETHGQVGLRIINNLWFLEFYSGKRLWLNDIAYVLRANGVWYLLVVETHTGNVMITLVISSQWDSRGALTSHWRCTDITFGWMASDVSMLLIFPPCLATSSTGLLKNGGEIHTGGRGFLMPSGGMVALRWSQVQSLTFPVRIII